MSPLGWTTLLLGCVTFGPVEPAAKPATPTGKSAPSATSLNADLQQKATQGVDKAIAFYRAVQRPDGSFADGEFGPPITGLAVAGMLRSGQILPGDPMIDSAMRYLRSQVQPDGGIYAAGGQRNYPTAISLLAFIAANKDGQYDKIIGDAVALLKQEQWDESEGIDEDNPKYGGAGYGKKSRPDLSNTAFMLEALDSAGLPKDDPAYQRALVFVSRCQNLSGAEGNDQPYAKLVDDGGFFYTPAEDYNPGGGDRQQGLRSYGSMTYAGLKSYLHANLDRDDPRFKAALGWIKKNYSVRENPGLGDQGLYYYYHTFAKTLNLMGLDSFEDEAGKSHPWREELVETLLDRQNPNGSWTNSNQRWLESDPQLVTGYALMALSFARGG